MYYKLVALKSQGIAIILHCFNYGRAAAPELEQLCEKVYYYERKTGLAANLSLLPYTVRSRRSAELENNLLKDQHPILFEVLHTCSLLNDARFKDRLKIYRHSNIEHDYYRELSRTERSLLKKLYLKAEAWKLKRFEPVLAHADIILAVNKKDTAYFKQRYPSAASFYLPSFHPDASVSARPGKGNFILFHGNLSVSENYEAAAWLVEKVFSKLSVNCVVAGLNPPDFLAKQIAAVSNVKLIASPPDAEMKRLLEEAQAHVLYTAQPTGLKLKLLNVLFKGRFVICNRHMIAGTDLAENPGLLLCDAAGEFISQVNACMEREFSEREIAGRKQLTRVFDNEANAEKLDKIIWTDFLGTRTNT